MPNEVVMLKKGLFNVFFHMWFTFFDPCTHAACRYHMAKRAWDDTGSKLVDATVGGKCTVFERSLNWRNEVLQMI